MDNDFNNNNDDGGGAPEWMVTYGDLVTLLMCFFVLLFAFSEIDAKKFEAVMQSFQGSAGVLQGGTSLSKSPLAFKGMPENDTTNETKEAKTLSDLKEEVEKALQEMDVEIDIKAEIIDRGLVIRFPDNALFNSGQARLKETSKEALTIIGDILKKEKFINKVIRVEGHTDNVPQSSLRYPSNWELSTARATNVIRYFLNESSISPKRLSASGYGEYHPIASNETAEGRKKNRRVDIVIMRSFFNGEKTNIDEDKGE